MIKIKDISYRYPTRGGDARDALSSVSLNVDKGRFAVVIGPNGSGKSTLFQILAGMIRPGSGQATLAGAPCGSPAARRSVGIVFQAPALDKLLTVRENLTFFGKLNGFSGQELDLRIKDVTAWTQIADRLDTVAGHLSGGQQRQAELAKCLIPAPPVLLLDEPTTGLDPAGRKAFQETILDLRDRAGLSILMTTHVFSEAEAANQVAILNAGKIIAQDTPQALCASLGTEMITIQAQEASDAALDHILNVLHQLGITASRSAAQDIRIDDLDRGHAAPLVGTIMDKLAHDIASIAIKQPTLDDVFLSLTTRGQA